MELEALAKVMLHPLTQERFLGDLPSNCVHLKFSVLFLRSCWAWRELNKGKGNQLQGSQIQISRAWMDRAGHPLTSSITTVLGFSKSQQVPETAAFSCGVKLHEHTIPSVHSLKLRKGGKMFLTLS